MKKKRKNYTFLAFAMYFVAVVIIACVVLKIFPEPMLLISVFCIALGGTMAGVQANNDFNAEVAERERKRDERRKKRRERRL